MSSTSMNPSLTANDVPLSPFAQATRAISDKYIQLGGEASFLGKPTADVQPAPDGVGFFQPFQGGSIYWHPATGAHEVHGDILGKWASMGWERSLLGYPVTDETTTPDGVGRFNHFQAGSIYWTPKTGAHEVHGDILGKWASMGWERSFLGYPTSDEMNTPDGTGRSSQFQHGSITWAAATRAVTTSPATTQFHSDIATQDWLPMGGWVNVVVNAEGQFTFSGHMHNSGFPNIDYALAVVVMTPSGIGYTFARQGHADGTVTIFGRNRDNDWTDPGANPQLAQHWDEVTQARLFWKLTAQDTLSAGIQGLIEDVAKSGVKALGAAGVAALIALI